MQRNLAWVAIIHAATILTIATTSAGCAKRSSPSSTAEKNSDTAPVSVNVEMASKEDEEPLDPPSLNSAPGPGSFYQGPPLKPPAYPSPGPYPAESIAAETVPPPSAIPDAGIENTGGSSTTSADTATSELIDENASPSGLVTLPDIAPSRIIRRRQDWTEAEVAADALGRIGAPATDEVVDMLSDADPRVRRRAAEILARIGSEAEQAIDPLIRVLEQDSDPQVRKAAAFALGQMGPKAAAAAPALLRRVREGSP